MAEGEGRNVGRAASMPPERHLGLGSYLPELPPPPSSIKGSNSGSVSGSKMKAAEGCSQGLPIIVSGSSSSAARNGQDCGTHAPATASGPEGIESQTQSQHQQQQVIQIDDDEEGGNDGATGTGPVKRQKRLTSNVWEHFTKKTVIVEENGKKYEQMAKYRAECNSGTSSFRNHLKSVHHIVDGQLQLKAEKDKGRDVTTIQPYRCDQEISVKKLYTAIIMHEYPFNIVEHDYFADFIKSLRPSFPLKSKLTIRKEIMDIYLDEKDKLYKYLKTVRSRFSATMDMWTSCQNKGYMCKRIVGFFHVEGRHTDHKLVESFTEVMVNWFVEKKLFSLTLDNAASNLVAVTDIIDDLRVNRKASLVCDGIFFHIRCACHILNLVARDGLAVISKAIEKIKSLVLTVKGSSLQWEELMKRASECGLDTSKGIQLDVSTRWNSTYLMLRDALHYKPAFIRLKSSNHRKYAKISPTDSEWDMAVKVFHCLKKFYDLTELLSGTSYPTTNQFYRGFCEIKELIDKWCIDEDLTIRAMAKSMSEKFEKYWSCSSLSLDVACFLDPRFKKKLVEYYMRKFDGAYYQICLDEFVGVVKNLFQFYASSKPKSKSDMNANQHVRPIDLFDENHDAELESFLYDDTVPDNNAMSELDTYMAEPLLKQHPFDILAYWKINTDKYPVLSEIARDMMAIQVSTVASESAFSAAGRVIDPYHIRLDAEMVQALICSKDWSHAARKDSKCIPCILAEFKPPETISPPMDEEVYVAEPTI
ncbi:hypothetical protein BS78_10G265500 [Paspalum vaginatum]|nr:hypothetical protein BS78_10G265500 [Paspalum vaginatum]